MKNNIILLCFSFFLTIGSYAQKGYKEKIKSMKIAHITQALDLTTNEAQKFWPVYNEHEQSMEKLRREINTIHRKNQQQSIESLDEETANNIVTKYISLEEQKFAARQKMMKELRPILTSKKIVLLIKAERDFHRRLMQELKHRRRKPR
ncbi:Spy/CpxP family protein refolding chaperone [Aquimarina hainanensis]|uniref:Spy/CpxP family protein refolding chaperone n=1 Tax=Aquimarina hainanensis TaxID=1578017 RepID=A0ABW5N424_9FLAO|nr:sensor of ECF-type sigma factor [Aquimarina sp. TRL1]QKX06253.1 sensor of ECF-type sigma factor [Aquimarina sp. TRL1]